jgi:hypothetical protein
MLGQSDTFSILVLIHSAFLEDSQPAGNGHMIPMQSLQPLLALLASGSMAQLLAKFLQLLLVATDLLTLLIEQRGVGGQIGSKGCLALIQSLLLGVQI